MDEQINATPAEAKKGGMMKIIIVNIIITIIVSFAVSFIMIGSLNARVVNLEKLNKGFIVK